MSETLLTAATTDQDTSASAAADATVEPTDVTATPAPDQQTAPAASEPAATEATKADAEPKPDGPPETYEFTAPEGQQYSDDVISAYSEVARDIGLTQEQAQKVLDRMSPAMAEAQTKQLDAAREGWVAAVKADKEIGGDHQAAALAHAARARDEFGTPELRDLLNVSGLGDHPEVVRMFSRVGKALAGDQQVVEGAAPKRDRTAAETLYPNMAQ